MFRIFAAALAIAAMSAPAAAIQLTQRGNVITLTGEIKDGDQFIVKDHLATAQGKQARVVYLNSNGGRVLEAQEMARSIRKAGLATVVDGARARCYSACTGLFAAGVTRHYINSGGVKEGDGGIRPGLAFHDGSALNQRGRKDFSGRATAGMINIYYEMGVSGAVSVVQKANFKNLYYLSGATALSLGIATSLNSP